MNDPSQCPKCGRSLRPRASFCGSCGEQVGVHCPSCDVINPAEESYCYDCGSRLYPPPWELVAEAEAPDPADVPVGQETPRSSGFGSCERCGSLNEPCAIYCYQCGLPLDDEPVHASGQAAHDPSPSSYRSPRARANWTIGLLLFVCFLAGIQLLMLSSKFDVVANIEVSVAAGRFISNTQLEELREDIAGINGLVWWFYLVAAVGFIMWEHRVSSNLSSLGAGNQRFSTGWAVGWWFIPMMNLFRPYQILAEIWRGSTTTIRQSWTEAPAPWVMGAWWALMIFSTFFRVLGTDMLNDDPVTTAPLWISLTGSLATMCSGLALIYVVSRITTQQEEKSPQVPTIV